MMTRLKAIFSKQEFKPGLIGIFINPFYFARQGLYEGIATLSTNIGGVVLDVGCGTKPYIDVFSYSKYIGLEIDSERNIKNGIADFYYDGHSFPFESAFFDSIICNQVLEHVFQPTDFLKEIHRVLKPGGKLLLSIPFVWDEHEQPWDFARYSSFGIKFLLESNGFTILEHKKTNADSRTLFQLINAYIYKITLTDHAKLNLLLCVLLIAPFNILGCILGKLLPKNNDLYLDQIVLSQKGEQ